MAHAGVQERTLGWMPAFAGMTSQAPAGMTRRAFAGMTL